MVQYVYDFSEGDRGMGANLAEMTRLGLPVPPGFTIATKACRAYLASARRRWSRPPRWMRTCMRWSGRPGASSPRSTSRCCSLWRSRKVAPSARTWLFA